MWFNFWDFLTPSPKEFLYLPYKPLKICHDAEITTKNLTFAFIFSKKKDSVFLIFADFFATLFHSLLYSAKMEMHIFYESWNSERYKSHRDLKFFVWLGDMFGYVSCLKHCFLSFTMCPGNHLKEVSNFLRLIWYISSSKYVYINWC